MSVTTLMLVLFLIGVPIGLMAFTLVLIIGEMEEDNDYWKK